MLAVCNPTYLEDHGRIDGSTNLDEVALIGFDEPRISWIEFLRHIGFRSKPPKQSMRFSDYSAVVDTCLDGRGVALGWILSVARLLAKGRLVMACDQSVKTGLTYDLVASPGGSTRPVVARVRD